ncbi:MULTISPECIES: L-ribulose-5-phosphate 4-epimerase [Thermoanaerobacterium]|uniref:L-ribulose-5-phosphate 4-epimerase n=3 Tax=Thermoanaerobacterium TaxID=28895 RepID=W9E933_9THEO|nr:MULTISPECIES: L-ribulose-5-phosphate 4-epimerase [Thermoanaerobacterium]AFK86296.1 class II aldolase/adducin family protein [Thermoanaerobacterium saccharolyticum JW/SL-YS485]ETO37360.1 class II aldolase/adducin family protein [Thermoanaerobacterium aotearoense SCUT27]MBP2071058.1 L-ribulose-5-phosphate 4-epimerase [Thermoanaerobacterium butyriciformans]
MLENLKQRVYKMNMMLPKNNLVTMTSGNVSGRDPETNLVVIKPSGVLYDEMTPDDMVVVDLDGNVVEGKLKPSVDTATHLYVYRHRNDVNGIVHTHSPYATSFAALGRSIPVYLTAIADEFGCAIPVGPYAKIGGEEIGKAIVDYIGESPAILMKNHGVFTIGNSPEAALKAAVMVEDTAKTVHLSLLLGTPDVIPDEEVKRAHERYLTKYGQ